MSLLLKVKFIIYKAMTNLTVCIKKEVQVIFSDTEIKNKEKQELSEDSNARLFEKLSQGCFIEYNNTYLYENIKLSEKVQRFVIKMFYRVNHCFIILSPKKAQTLHGDPSLQAKPLPRILKSKKGHSYEKTHQQELWDLCQSCKIITENKCVKFKSIIPSVVMEIPAYTQKLNHRDADKWVIALANSRAKIAINF
jgi:hypothetical protein